MKKIKKIAIWLIALTSLAVFLYIFLNSFLFLNLVEYLIQKSTDKDVEISSLSFDKGHGIILLDTTIKEKGDTDPFVALPRVEIAFSLSGLLKKSIDGIYIKEPKIFLKQATWKRSEDGSAGSSLPFSFRRLFIESGEIRIEFQKDKALHISAINLSFTETDRKKAMKVAGSAFIPELGSKISIDAGLDTGNFKLDKGHADISLLDLRALSAEKIFTLPEGMEINGNLDLGIDILSQDGLGIELEGSFHDLNIRREGQRPFSTGASGRLKSFLTLSEDFQAVKVIADITADNLFFRYSALRPEMKENYLHMSFEGGYMFQEDRMDIVSMNVQTEKLLSLAIQGSLEELSSGNPDLRLTVESNDISLSAVKERLTPLFTDALDITEVEGNGDLRLAVTGRVKSPHIKGTLYIKGSHLRRQGISLESFEMRFPDFEYSNSAIKPSSFHFSADRLSVRNGNKELYADKKISLDGLIEGNAGMKQWKLKDISLKTGLIKNINAEVILNTEKHLTAEVSAKYSDDDIGKIWKGFSASFNKANPPGITGKGAIQSNLSISVPGNAPPFVKGAAFLNIREGGFSSADGMMAGEGFKIKASANFGFSLPLSAIDFTGRIEAAGFELLLGRFYGSFKDRAVILDGNGEYNNSENSLKISRAELSIAGIGEILFSGTATDVTGRPDIDATAEFKNFANGPVYDLFVKDTFKESFPLLAGLNIDGTSSAKLSLKGRSGMFNVRGDVMVKGMNVANVKSGLSVTEINMSLPVNLTYPKASLGKEDMKFGSLGIKGITARNLTFENIEAFPSAWQNEIIFKKDITLPVFGGSVSLRDLHFRDILSPERSLLLVIDLRDIDLANASSAFNLPEFEGSVSGTIPVNVAGSRLSSEGNIVLKLFGGEMIVSDLSVDNIFSPAASFKSSIRFRELNLGELTKTLEFGHVSGVINGEVKNLVIANRQAQRFDAFMESVKRKGIGQRINVEAIKKISILSSGMNTSLLNRGIYRFFKDYRYEKIGFRASLRNDAMSLSGTTVEGDKRYLIKGGLLPPKVDVISHTSNISFQEMVKRLKRVRQMEKK